MLDLVDLVEAQKVVAQKVEVLPHQAHGELEQSVEVDHKEDLI